MDAELAMRTLWTPSKEQDQSAFEHLSLPGGPEKILTAHLLVGKAFGWWGDGITVEPIDGLYVDRDMATSALLVAGLRRHNETGKPVIGGYTYHRLPRQGDPAPTSAGGIVWLTSWALFEDILAMWPAGRP